MSDCTYENQDDCPQCLREERGQLQVRVKVLKDALTNLVSAARSYRSDLLRLDIHHDKGNPDLHVEANRDRYLRKAQALAAKEPGA